jgi:hypothetical protein
MVKHAICDLWLQTLLGNQNKISYFGNGWRHYLEHGFGTLCVLVWFVPIEFAIACAVCDYILHWHIDWAKTNYQTKMDVNKENKVGHFWCIQSTDQSLHFLTYYAFIKFLY